MMSLWDALRMNMMISYQELVRTFHKKYTVGRLNDQETRYITIPLQARFYQYGPTTSTGEVESHMIFNLTYD
ncbi:fimbrial protein [Klebsiella pneumoniae]|nr:fimbrial protein [Klebsiella pneumoniae]